MRFASLIREGWAAARASVAATSLILVVAAAACVLTISTVGRTNQAERVVQGRMDAVGSRLVTIRDLKSADLITPSVVDSVAHLSTVDVAAGFTLPVDAVNGAIGSDGTKVAYREVRGPLSRIVQLEAGRWPRRGEAIVADSQTRALGIQTAAGWVTAGATDAPIVGVFHSVAPFADETKDTILAPAGPDTNVTSLVIQAKEAGQVDTTAAVASKTIGPADNGALGIELPASLAQVQQQVARDLGSYSRSLFLAILAAAGAIVAIVVLLDVVGHRRDLGRRRVLGASRAGLIAIVVVRTTLPAAVGAVIGTVAGLASWASDLRVDYAFGAAVAILIALASMLSSLLPAAFIATRDPVRVLRTP